MWLHFGQLLRKIGLLILLTSGHTVSHHCQLNVQIFCNPMSVFMHHDLRIYCWFSVVSFTLSLSLYLCFFLSLSHCRTHSLTSWWSCFDMKNVNFAIFLRPMSSKLARNVIQLIRGSTFKIPNLNLQLNQPSLTIMHTGSKGAGWVNI